MSCQIRCRVKEGVVSKKVFIFFPSNVAVIQILKKMNKHLIVESTQSVEELIRVSTKLQRYVNEADKSVRAITEKLDDLLSSLQVAQVEEAQEEESRKKPRLNTTSK